MSQFRTCISALVLEEAGRGNPDRAKKRLQEIDQLPVLEIDEEARALPENLISAVGPYRRNTLKMHFLLALLRQMGSISF
jgi:hypothetical protein